MFVFAQFANCLQTRLDRVQMTRGLQNITPELSLATARLAVIQYAHQGRCSIASEVRPARIAVFETLYQLQRTDGSEVYAEC